MRHFFITAGVAAVILVGYFGYQSFKDPVGSGGFGSLWYIVSSNLRPVSATLGLQIPSLTNCDTIDTTATGVFECGTDSGGAGTIDGTGIAGLLASWTDSNTLTATATPTVAAIRATTSATSTFTGGIQARGFNATTFVTLMGETFTNFTTYVRSLFTGGTGIAVSSGDITFDCSEVEGTGINCSGENITLDNTGDWTGTVDGNNFAGGAIAAGDILYGASAGSITELGIGASSTVLTTAGTVPKWERVFFTAISGLLNLTNQVTGALGIANGGLGAAFTDPNADRLMFWDDSAGFITGIATLTGAAISGTTLTINDVTCTDCLTTTEIADSYLLNNGDVGTGVFDFGGATSWEIVNGTGPTVDTLGEIAFDTTDNQLLIATGTTARAIPTITKLWGRTVASTSADFISGGRQPLTPHRDGVVITEIHCYVDGGTSKVINLDTLAGGANTDSLTCGTTLTSDTALPANTNLSAGALMAVEFGATTGTVDYVTFSVWGYVKPE